MGDILEYQSRRRLMAEKLESAERVNSSSGPRWANAGDYVVYTGEGAFIVPGHEFEAEYEVIPTEVSKFSPEGKTVPEVLEFLKNNPGEVDRVKEIEAKNGERKGILDYEIG